jgi:hypothetical protein
VGLLFAGGSERTFANRIDLVLREFGVWIDGSAATEIIDVAVTSVDAPSPVDRGELVDVDVTVRNVGTEAVGGFDVTLVDLTDGLPELTQTVDGLAAGASTILTYQWDTTDETPVDHVLEAGLTLAGDENPSNDAATTTVTVNDPSITCSRPDSRFPVTRIRPTMWRRPPSRSTSPRCRRRRLT